MRNTGMGILKVVAAVGLIALVGLAAVWVKGAKGRAGHEIKRATFTSQRGPLTISVLESGTIKAKDQIIIQNEVEGRRSIIYLVDEGTQVRQGDKLVELDSGSLRDSLVDQQIRVDNAAANLIDAQENLEVVKNQGRSDVARARLDLQFAEQDLEQYREPNGLYDNEVMAMEATLRLRNEEMVRARDVYEWSDKLFQEKYVSHSELQADELKLKSAQLQLDKAQNDLRIFKKYTHVRRTAELTSAVDQARMALERVERRSRAGDKQAEAKLRATEKEHGRQQEKLAKIRVQIDKCLITAPADGLVIYATSVRLLFNQQPLDEGQEVHERQELIHLPKTDSVMAEVNIHEANLHKVRADLPVVVTLDALPGQRFFGTVRSIAPLPNTNTPLTPDLKVYKSEIDLETKGAVLRSGMSCKARIIVKQYEDVVHVPVQAVLNVGGDATVYVVENGTPVPCKVALGLDNNVMACIEEGLAPGDVVLLAPPLEAASASGTAGADPNALGQPSGELGQQIRDQLETTSSAEQSAS